MARSEVSGFEELSRDLGQLSRESVKRIVKAGSQTAVERMRRNTQKANHIRSGDMIASIGATDYTEWLGGGKQEIYPLGTDHRGVRNATKAYVINYGRSGKRGVRSGDRFITADESAAEAEIVAAMKAENDRIIDEMNGG